MADVQIVAGGTSAAPLAYTVPGAQEIIVKALFATFDGSGAGGDFLPCIRVLAPGGKVVGEYITDSAVTAGDSAEVSFAPFLKGAPAATGPPDCPFVLAFNQLGTAQTISTATDTNLSYASLFLYSNDLTQTYYSSPDNFTVTINALGTYLVQANADYTDPGSYVSRTQIVFTTSGGNKSVLTSDVFKMAASFLTSDVFPVGISYGHTMHDILRIVNVPCSITLVTRQESGADKHVRNRGVAIYRLAGVGRSAPWP